MNKHVRASLALLLLAGVLTLSSCAAFDQMASALANLQRLKFKLSGVRDFRLLGLDISGKTMLSEFNALDALRLVEAYRSMKLPVDFIVDVLAVNPNDGTGETRQTTSTLTGLECRLLIDGRPTIVGNIDQSVEIPGTGRESVIPLRLSFDLFEFFAGEQYEDLIQLALAIGGKNRTATRIALDAQPTVSTPAGPITYPGRVTIVSTEFR